MYEATFTIPDSTAYTEPTAGTDCRVRLWCNEHSDLLYVAGAEIQPLLAQVDEDVGIAQQVRGDEEAVVVTSSCLTRHEASSVDRYLADNNCLLLPPLRYEDGAKHCRVLALDALNLTEFYDDLVADGFDVDVRTKREVRAPTQSAPLLALEDVLPELTGRQREVLTLAVEEGYYDLPRGVATADLADELGLGRRTTEDHLRRAEKKLVTGLVSYLY